MQEYRTAKVTLTAGTPAEINLHNAHYDSATYAGATVTAIVDVEGFYATGSICT